MSYQFSGGGWLANSTRGPVDAGTSFTVAVWFRAPDVTTTQSALFRAAHAPGLLTHYLSLSMSGSTGLARATTSSGVVAPLAIVSAPAPTDNQWLLYIGAWTATSTVALSTSHCYGYNSFTGADTGSVVTADVSATITDLSWPNSFSVGAGQNSASSYTQYLTGEVAHVGLWNCVLTYSEMLELRTVAPPYVANGNVVAYWSLLANAAAEIGGTDYDLTPAGDAVLSSNIGPSITLWTGGSSAAPKTSYYQMLRRA